jgi:hypothetical protein
MSNQYADTYKPYRAGAVEWIYPHEQEPPRGVKLHILQGGCISIQSQWAEGQGYKAWQYMFKRNKEKEVEYEKFLASKSKTE